jgi:RimJ/RimL family protein N-acetyltransferase
MARVTESPLPGPREADAAAAAVVVRPARPDEWTEAGRIAEDSYRAAGHLDTDTGYDAVLRDVASRAEPGPVLVATIGGQLVGTVTITPAGAEHAEIARPGEVEFRYLGVEPSAWGSGVARAMVDAVVAHARAVGAARLVCCVIDWNEPAHRLYQRYGFERAPERDWTPVPGIDLLAYELSL